MLQNNFVDLYFLFWLYLEWHPIDEKKTLEIDVGQENSYAMFFGHVFDFSWIFRCQDMC